MLGMFVETTELDSKLQALGIEHYWEENIDIICIAGRDTGQRQNESQLGILEYWKKKSDKLTYVLTYIPFCLVHTQGRR